MSTATFEVSRPSVKQRSGRTGQLALALQEAFTVAVRVRANRQVAADLDAFRAHIKALLAGADRDARQAGYDGGHVKLAIYAFVAFLDESVLKSSNPVFAGWSRQPLQEEIFGDHVAGEAFFRKLEDLLGRQDSEPLADVLEVYQLCLCLGFRGRYGSASGDQLRGLVSSIQAKIDRIRGPMPELSPSWRPPADEVGVGPDPWLPRLAMAAGAIFLLALVLFGVFRLALGGGVDELVSLPSLLP
jgi:type VI secretion system protein ImpK